MRLRELDYKEGTFTYAERIALGEVWKRDDLREYQKLREAWRELYGWDCRWMPIRMRVRRLMRLAEGVEWWFRLEEDTLKAEPTAEQLKAGIRELAAKVGDMGTVKALAKDYGTDPDVVLTWQWGKVYGILLTDLEENRYTERLQRIMMKRYDH